jgi:hypothetical protein
METWTVSLSKQCYKILGKEEDKSKQYYNMFGNTT